ncbi:MAG: hypothetical protein QXJ17_07655 [Nitrososphaeria archaeon]
MLIRKTSVKDLLNVNRIIFDCDGVLVESKNSYDLAIRETLRYIFKPLNFEEISLKELENLRLTGLYNIEWDTTFALAIFVFSQLTKKQAKAILEYLGGKEFINKVEELDNSGIARAFNEFVKGLKKDPVGDVEEYARRLCSKKNTVKELGELVRILGKPNEPNKSYLVKLFDSLYYGNSLYTKVYGTRPPLNLSRGFIENEKLLVNEDTLKDLKELFGTKFYILTGRSRIGVEHVLIDLKDFFDFDHSIFIEDMVRTKPEEARDFKKPSPIPLLNLANNSNSLYVGDSAEDVIMSLKAKEMFQKLYFIGVTGNKANPKQMEEFLMSSGADALVDSVNDLVCIFKSIKRSDIF